MRSNNNNNIDTDTSSISYFIEEIEMEPTNKLNYEELLGNVNNNNNNDEFNNLFNAHIINYKENFTVKTLLIICEYYGFLNKVKNKKNTKDVIIETLVSFELDSNNSNIVNKRLNLWFLMNELKNDIFMKKFVIW